MKRNKGILMLLCLLLTLLFALPALAEEAQPLPQVGDSLQGFTVKDVYAIPQTDITVVTMTHDKTGAELLYFATDAVERSFSIAFRTPTPNDKGLPHVFEHSTLSGSEKYPDPSLFFSMISQTYNTFLNAETHSNFTIYPCASLSEDQLYKFVDYDMAGVFYPMIMTDEHAMMREAYRYELTDKDSDITLTGTVYSEMLGASNQNTDLYYSTLKLLYPGSTIGNNSGGKPSEIATMTYDELKAFHDSYYHPSNALITLYGKLDLERFLGLIDGEYLSRFDRSDLVIEDAAYTPAEGFSRETITYPVSASEASSTMMMYGIAMRGMTEEEKLIMEQLGVALSLEGMPLSKLLKETFPEITVQGYCSMDQPDPMLSFTIVGTKAENADAVKAIIDESLAQCVAGGIDREILHNAVRGTEISVALTGEASNAGVSFATSFATLWANLGDVTAFQRRYDVVFNLDEIIDSGILERILEKYALTPAASALVISTSVPGGKEEADAALGQQLVDMKAAMTDEELDALIARTADFAAWTESNASSSMIAEMQAVTIDTLPEEIVTYQAQEETVDGIRFVTCEAETSGVVSTTMYLDSACLTMEELPYYALYSSLVGLLDTDQMTKAQIIAKKMSLTNCSYIPSFIAFEDGSYHPYLVSNWYTLDRDVQTNFDFMENLLLHTAFTDYDAIRTAASNNLLSNSMTAGIMTDSLVSGYASAMINPTAAYDQFVNSEPFDALQSKVVAASDEELTAILTEADRVWQKVMNRNHMIVTIVGDAEGIAATRAAAQAFAAKLSDDAQTPVTLTFEVGQSPLAIETTNNMLFNAEVVSLRDNDIPYSIKLDVMTKIVTDKYLMPILRFQNSVYSVRHNASKNGVLMMSYRDLSLQSTYEVYAQLPEMIRTSEITQEELNNYIISSYTSVAQPYGPLTGGGTAVLDVLQGTSTFAETLAQMQELKSMTPEDVKGYAELYALLAEKGVKVTAGSATLIEENRDFFAEINTHYMQ